MELWRGTATPIFFWFHGRSLREGYCELSTVQYQLQVDVIIIVRILVEEEVLALLNWNDRYSVGVKVLDDQHKGLIGILNELHEAMLKAQAESVSGPLLQRLLDYTRVHFAAEDRFMSESRFPGLAQHRAQHEALTQKLGEYLTRRQRGETGIQIQLLHFLRDWLATHIQKEDKEYGPWLNEHGIQ